LSVGFIDSLMYCTQQKEPDGMKFD
jgi:hypothetical protein